MGDLFQQEFFFALLLGRGFFIIILNCLCQDLVGRVFESIAADLAQGGTHAVHSNMG